MLGMSSMMGEFKVSSLVDNIILMNWVELGDSFRHALTVAKMRAMPTSRTTHECEIVNGLGIKVLQRPLRAVLPVVHFAGYLGLISRSPERRPPRGAKAFSAPKRFEAVVTRRPEDIEPTNEEFLAALILFGPLAYVARWIWRRLRELA